MKKFPMPLIIRKMKIETKMRYNLTPARMATINRSTKKYWQSCEEKKTLDHCCREHRMVQPPWKTVWSFLKKIKMELAFDPAIPLLGIYPKNPETPIRKHTWTPMFTVALFTIAKICKQPKWPSVDDWIKKLWYLYTMEYYLAMKKKEILSFVTTWMDPENIMLSEISQSEKDKYPMILLICRI